MNKITKTIAGVIATLAFVAVFATSANAAFTRSLTIGSTGPDVTELQSWLVSKGYLVMPTGVNYGYFGMLTKQAVAAFQTANGITPAVGYFGPITQAKVASMGSTGGSTVAGCTSTSGFSTTTGAPCSGGGSTSTVAGCTSTIGYSPTTGQKCDASVSTSTGSTDLSGENGTIDDVNNLSTYNNEDVGEDTTDVKVLGFELDASADGDIAINSIKVSFDPAGNASGDSDNLDDYISKVTIWQGDEEIGSADVDEFNEDDDNVFSKTISVSDSVVKADETENFYVTVDAASSFDSGDIDSDSWTVDVESIRFEDGSGVVTTDSSTGDINAMNVGIAFVTFSTSADTELKISTDSDTPTNDTVIVDDTDNTDNVSLLKGSLKLEGTSDVVLDEFPVTFTVTGTAANIASTTGSVILKIDGEEFTESVSVALSGLVNTITFDNLDLIIDAGSTIEFEVLADINDLEASFFVAGDTLKATITASNRSLFDAENEAGDQLTEAEKTGTATGEEQIFRTSGIQLALVSTATAATTGTSANDDVGLFTIRYTVKAVGDAVYISSLADATTGANTSGYTSVTVDKAGTATAATSMSVSLVNQTDTSLTSVGNYLIEEGQTETFEVSVSVPLGTGGTSGQYRAALSGVRWSLTDVYPVATSYTSNLDTFKTSYAVLN